MSVLQRFGFVRPIIGNLLMRTVQNVSDISKLLDQLGQSEAWTTAIAKSTASTTALANDGRAQSNENTVKDPLDSDVIEAEAPVAASARVSSLLDLLGKPSRSPSSTPWKGEQDPTHRILENTSERASDEPAIPQDVRNVLLAEALQIITKLTENPVHVKHLREIREEQSRLEKKHEQMWDQTLQKQRKVLLELKTQVAITGPLGPHKVERLKAQFEKELVTLQQDEILPAWNRLLHRQQATLQRMGVPWMFETDDPSELRKQQQVMGIMEGLIQEMGSGPVSEGRIRS